MTNKKRNWIPVYYRSGMERNIINLMNQDIKIRGSQAVFNLDFWNWKYRNNNAGFFENWILLAKSKNSAEIAGHYTAIPVNLRANKKTVLSAQSVDTLTNIDFRKQGIFSGLARICYEETMRNGVDILYGYPNQNSYPGFVKKLGWNHPFTVREMAFVLNPDKIAALKYNKSIKKIVVSLGMKLYFCFKKMVNKLIVTKALKIKENQIQDFDFKLIDGWISSRYKYYIERSYNYYEWRYGENPIDCNNIIIKSCIKEKKVKGYYILKIKEYPHRKDLKVGHIMEIINAPNDKVTLLIMINDIIKTCCKHKADIIHAYTHKFQHDYPSYRKIGFIQYDFKDYIIRINKHKDKYPDVLNPKNWYVSLGDSDRA